MRISNYPEVLSEEIGLNDSLILDTEAGTKSLSIETAKEVFTKTTKNEVLNSIDDFNDYEDYPFKSHPDPIVLAQESDLPIIGDEMSRAIGDPIIKKFYKAKITDLINNWRFTNISFVDKKTIFRGKAFEEYSGNFVDIYIGDSFNIDGVRWVVADVNYFPYINEPHMIIIPTEAYSGSSYMYESESTYDGYRGCVYRHSEIRNTLLDTIGEYFRLADVGLHNEHVGNSLEVRAFDSTNIIFEKYTTEATNMELLSEEMVFGHRSLGVLNSGNTQNRQLALFRFAPSYITARMEHSYWLRNPTVINGNGFSYVSAAGTVHSQQITGATQELFYRPFAVIKMAENGGMIS